jgi:hypothetical protein
MHMQLLQQRQLLLKWPALEAVSSLVAGVWAEALVLPARAAEGAVQQQLLWMQRMLRQQRQEMTQQRQQQQYT